MSRHDTNIVLVKAIEWDGLVQIISGYINYTNQYIIKFPYIEFRTDLILFLNVDVL